MAIDAPVRAEPAKIVSAGKAVGTKAVQSGDAVLGVFDGFYGQLKFYARIFARVAPRPPLPQGDPRPDV